MSGRPEFQTITSSRFHLSESKSESTVIVWNSDFCQVVSFLVLFDKAQQKGNIQKCKSFTFLKLWCV